MTTTPSSASQPSGWVLVPREPTEEMRKAGWAAYEAEMLKGRRGNRDHLDAAECAKWSAMLSSVPAFPSTGEERARELLAAELGREGLHHAADEIRHIKPNWLTAWQRSVLRAIEAALTPTASPIEKAGAEEVTQAVEAERERCARIADAVAERPIEGLEHGVWERAERRTGKSIARTIRSGAE